MLALRGETESSWLTLDAKLPGEGCIEWHNGFAYNLTMGPS